MLCFRTEKIEWKINFKLALGSKKKISGFAALLDKMSANKDNGFSFSKGAFYKRNLY